MYFGYGVVTTLLAAQTALIEARDLLEKEKEMLDEKLIFNSFGARNCPHCKTILCNGEDFETKIIDLETKLKIAVKALKSVIEPDWGGAQGMIITDMGFKHFAEQTAKIAIAEINKPQPSCTMNKKES